MARRNRIILGLNSGTSADGVDAVACEIADRGLAMRVRYLGMTSRRYSSDLRSRILSTMAPAETRTEVIGSLHRDIGLLFAKTAASLVKKLDLKRIDLIGSHGQTVGHYPPAKKGRSSAAGGWSLQLGDPALIAARLCVPVVSNFRQADLAVGGQGAPLVPWTDLVLFGDKTRNRIVQNIGGIANLTYLPAGAKPEHVVAFDTGPGNMMIDAIVAHFTKGCESYDRNGRRAANGQINAPLFDEIMNHPYFRRRPPKSCGREEFGVDYVSTLLKRFGRNRINVDDWIATATRVTANSVVNAYKDFIPDVDAIDEVILCGGGAKNATLVKEIESKLQDLSVKNGNSGDRRVRIATTADYGIPIQAKECVSFAMLAAARADGICANLPQVTGAARPVVLGLISG